MKKSTRTIGFKMLILFALFSLVLCLALTLFSYLASRNSYQEIYSTHAQNTAQMVATMVDGDRIGAYLEGQQQDDYYEELQRTFNDIKREMDLIYLYIFEPHMDHFIYIMEAYLDTDDPEMISKMGERFDYTYLEYEFLVPDIEARQASTDIVYSPNIAGYGSGISAWAPVFNSGGDMVAMVEVDFPFSRVEETLGKFLMTIVLLSCGITLLLIILLFLLMRRMISRPLKKLTGNVSRFASREVLTPFVDDIKTGDEMQILSEAFGKMADDINEYTKNLAAVAADKERIATELNLATDIQTSLLLRDFPAFPERDEFDLYAITEPAREVGGDFYDFFLITPTKLCVVVADVSSRGIPAALFMVVAKTTIKNQMMAGMPVDEAMSLLNTRLYESSSADMTVPAFVGVLDIDTGVFSYVNAGQNTPLLLRNGARYEWLRSQLTTRLAQSKNVVFRAVTVTLRQGDRLFLYTDGVINTKDASGEYFGGERLRNSLNTSRLLNAGLQELVRQVRKELELFADCAEQNDDITMLALEYSKGDKAMAEMTIPMELERFGALQAFIKRQLAENRIGGVVYTRVVVMLEELFVLVAGHQKLGDITVQCSVKTQPRRVEVRMYYGGAQWDPLTRALDAQQEAIQFLKANTDSLQYAYSAERNLVMFSLGVPGE